jgi:hypothetical protein
MADSIYTVNKRDDSNNSIEKDESGMPIFCEIRTQGGIPYQNSFYYPRDSLTQCYFNDPHSITSTLNILHLRFSSI